MNKIQKKLDEALTGRFKLAAALQKREQERKAKDEARAAREKQQQQPVKTNEAEICSVCESDPCICDTGKHVSESDLHSQFAAFAASRGGKMTTSAERKQATADLMAKREKEAASRPKVEPQKTTPYKPLGGRDEKSGRSYSEGVELDEASKQKLMIGSKVTHPDHGKGTVVMHAQGGGTTGTIVKFARGKRVHEFVKVDHKKLKMAEEVELVDENLDESWYKTGKEATHMATGQKTYEYQKVDKEGKPTGERHYRNADGKVLGEESELGDLAHQKTMKHRFLVSYSDPNHTMVTKRKEKQQMHVLVPGTTKTGSTVYQGEAEPLVKKHMKKQGYKVHSIEHVGMVSKKVYEAADTKPGWMLRQDPVLAKKVADAQKLAKKRQASYGDPSKGVSVKEDTFKQFRDSLVEKTLTPAEKKKREDVAKAIERENPGMPMGMKMAIATKTAKRVAEETVIETKGAPKGFHFTRDGKLKRGDANQDGDGGSMLRSDPLDKQRNKIPAVSEGEHLCAKHVRSSILGDGIVLEAQHASPDESGQIEWYMVEFRDGIRKVYSEDLEIMLAEYHGNHKKKKMTNG